MDGFRVFFAPDQESEYIAEDMIAQFYRVYRYESRYVTAFVTEEYLGKDVTMHPAAATQPFQNKWGSGSCALPPSCGAWLFWPHAS